MNILVLFTFFSLTQSYLVHNEKDASFNVENIQSRIIGGETARGSQFPFAAAIYATFPDGTFFCGGSIISNQWILTAAQCVFSASLFRIQVGSTRLDGEDSHRVTLATSTYVVHPEYVSGSFEHDIGLIRLRLPIEFNEYISAINLPIRALEELNTVVTAIGWGQGSDENDRLVNDLQFVELAPITNLECEGIYGRMVTDHMICIVGQENEGICTGDSGGPLIEYRNERSAVHVAVGTFHSSQGCDNALPSGFTRTYHYIDWIRNVTEIIN